MVQHCYIVGIFTEHSMLLSYNRLVKLVEDEVITPVEHDQINSASIDVTLDKTILLEGDSFVPVDLAKKKNIDVIRYEMPKDGYVLAPGAFILASTIEVFNLPNNISSEYKLKSSMARNGLEHLNAGWADAGWNGSKLTLELKNMTKSHYLQIKQGMRIGQMVFFEHEPVPEDRSYAARGQYNGQEEVTASKGIR